MVRYKSSVVTMNLGGWSKSSFDGLLFDVLLIILYMKRARGGGDGDSHMKQTGMLVVSLRGVNFGFWSCLGCSGQSANILSRQGLV